MANNKDIDQVIILVNKSKASDNVDWNWLQMVMEKFYFGPKLITCIFIAVYSPMDICIKD